MGRISPGRLNWRLNRLLAQMFLLAVQARRLFIGAAALSTYPLFLVGLLPSAGGALDNTDGYRRRLNILHGCLHIIRSHKVCFCPSAPAGLNFHDFNH
ncbi:hypothetical protein DFH06DRAFT_434328 [Mycena polygramma]|nr:hypothetical protein DFH06DRAFT_434328 [Mycena polygramma]